MVAGSSHGLVRVPLQEVPLYGQEQGILARDGTAMELTWGPLFGFVGDIQLGNPPQTFRVLMDTGSCDLYVGSMELCYNGLYYRQYCSSHNVYDSSKSRTSKTSNNYYGTLPYDAGTAVGPAVMDTLNVQGITVPNAAFVQATYLNGTLAENGPMDGIFGLSFQGSCVVSSLSDKNTNLIQTPVFSFYINKNSIKGSQMILGGVDPNLFKGELTYINLDNPTRFTVSVDSIRYNGNELRMQPTSGLIDTGTTSILLPQYLYDQLFYYGKPCEQIDQLPTVTFRLGGHEFSLEGEYYTTWNDGKCYNRIYPFPREHIVVGTIFLRKYYSVFNMNDKTIGLALAA